MSLLICVFRHSVCCARVSMIVCVRRGYPTTLCTDLRKMTTNLCLLSDTAQQAVNGPLSLYMLFYQLFVCGEEKMALSEEVDKTG